MSLTNISEKSRLKNWAMTEKDSRLFFNEESETAETFWAARKQEESYIMEYSFETLQEFENLCKKFLNERAGKNIQRVVSVAAFKNTPQDEMEDTQQEALPEYRYTF